MISIVVCSVDEKMFGEFSQNVQSTIGVPFEIIRIDNRGNPYSICEAYNKGKVLCNYDIICFSHEDILFETDNWGRIVMDGLKDPQTGLLGVLGICYLSLFPNDWIPLSEAEGQIRVGAKPEKPVESYSRFPGSSFTEVAAVDGVFLATRRDVIENIKFSDDLLKGFHGYDLDFSWQIRQQYKLVVTRDILFLHHSNVSFNAAYHEAMRLLAQKWQDYLPAYISAYSDDEIRALKIRSLEAYCQKSPTRSKLIRNNITAFNYAAKHGVLSAWVNKKIRNKLRRLPLGKY